jgi:hypothetical protein
MNSALSQTVSSRFSELCALCPDMRFGQIVATLGVLAEDDPGRSLWEVEDDELLSVIERFRQDLQRRQQNVG